jgi:hypothetical protein
VNRKRGWVDRPRPKTGLARRCSLRPETVKVLQHVPQRRPQQEQQADQAAAVLESIRQRISELEAETKSG